LPWWRLDLHRQPLGACGEQEITATGAFEKRALTSAEMKSLLQPGRLAGTLGTEEDHRRVGCNHRALL
jgi:hypothetical protein